MGGIPFTEIPESLLVPGQYQEIDPSLAAGGTNKKIALIIGQKLAAGTAVKGTEYTIASEAAARTLFADGADLTILAKSFLDANRVEELRAIALDDKADGVAAIWKMTITLSSHKTGTVPLYIDGILNSYGIKDSEAIDAIVANTVAAINGKKDSPVEASTGEAGTGEVIITHQHKGEIGNYLDLRFSLFGEKLPEGFSAVFEKTTAGSGNPDVADAISGMKEIRYNWIISSIHDAANMVKYEAELDRRYTAEVQKGCRLFIAVSGTATEINTYADARNNPHVSILIRGKNPESVQKWASRGCAIICRKLSDDPSANINGLKLGLVASVIYSHDERQTFLEKGVSTYTAGADGIAYVGRQVTTYTKNSDGDRDTSYLDIQIPETLDAIREHINTKCSKVYAGYKLARTEENFGSASKVMTPTLFTTFLLSTYQQDFIQEKQWCQDFETYRSALIVEASVVQDKTRLDYKHQPQLIGQFLIAAGVMQYQ